jgi:hypothetical protein
MSRSVAVSSSPDCLSSTFCLVREQPTTFLSSAQGTGAVRKMKAVRSENEEDEGADALLEAQVSFDGLCAFRMVRDRQLIAPRLLPSLYPLRC